ncbi:MAG: hypothetical protein V4591_06245, partial [Bdellovibrionota bacterium]
LLVIRVQSPRLTISKLIAASLNFENKERELKNEGQEMPYTSRQQDENLLIFKKFVKKAS